MHVMTKNDRDVVLLVTHHGDHYTIDRVAEELAARGVRSHRLDSDRFPSETPLSTILAGSCASGRRTLRDANGVVDIDSVRAVWMRRLGPAALDDDLDPRMRQGCVRESVAALRGFLAGLPGRRPGTRL